jgi:hypothetical protein
MSTTSDFSAGHVKANGPRLGHGYLTFKTALILAACGLFLISRSIATGGRVHIDDAAYWLLGTLPLIAQLGLAFLCGRSSPEVDKNRFAVGLIIAWVVTLVAFCVTKDLHAYEVIRSALQGTGGANYNLGNFIVGGLLSLIGAAVFLAIFFRRSAEKGPYFFAFVGSLLLNAVMLQLLVLQ